MNTLAARMIVIGLVIHTVLLPILFTGLSRIVEQSHKDGFVNDVRKYSRFLADVFESGDIIGDRDREIALLDSAVMGSGGVFAELVEGVIHIRSELSPMGTSVEYREDYGFGEHGDDIYFVSITLQVPDRHATLRLGFDEGPTNRQIALAREELVLVLGAYLVASIIALVFVSTLITRPLRRLQFVSRNIADGKHADQIAVDSSLTEIAELARDLETMRSTLVGMNVSLKEEIAERKALDQQREVLENKLRQVDKLETVGVLAGGIAHEFNNILLPIFLYTEQAKHDLPAESPVRKHLDQVLKSSKRAKGLVQQILTFSRQSGDEHFESVDLKAVVVEAANLLRALLPTTVELRQELPDESCMVLADRNQLHQLIINLGSNAFQAIAEGHGRITVSLERVEVDEQFVRDHPLLTNGRYVRLGVEDTGHGLDRAKIDRIFEPFYTTRAVGEGTGLGLSVVHGIVMAHKGDITVQSEPGSGTVFHVYLPEYDQGDAANGGGDLKRDGTA